MEYLDITLFHLRTSYRNGRIVLPNPHPSGLIDPQKDVSLVFFIKQKEYGLSFPFSPFFNEVFRYFEITPRILTPNAILFMSSFESVYLSRDFVPTVRLFISFFRLVKASQKFYYFAPRGGLF